MATNERKKPTKLFYRVAAEQWEPQIEIRRLEIWLGNSSVKSDSQYLRLGDRQNSFHTWEEAKTYALDRADRNILELTRRLKVEQAKRDKYAAMQPGSVLHDS